jgi:riboflavin biosynthesis pyrimidine reductase
VSARFLDYCRARESAAAAAVLSPYRTEAVASNLGHFHAIGNEWSRALFDGDFYRSSRKDDIPVTNLVFVESRDGNTGTDDPSTLGGGQTDKYLIYEGLSRVEADAVLAGATTAASDDLVFSIWHPQMVALRLAYGRARHPAQVIVCGRRSPRLETALMFQVPDLPVFLLSASDHVASLSRQTAGRPWITVIDSGQPLSMRTGLRALKAHGIGTVSTVGGRTTARALLREGLVHDLYLTMSPLSGGQPNTPLFDAPIAAPIVLKKEGTGSEAGVQFVHYSMR